MLEGISPVHLIIVLVVAILILGPGKLPETGAALGKAVRDFRRGLTDDVTATPAPGAVATTPEAHASISGDQSSS
jgi:sec-independent protein translocase protein TatA